MLTVGTKDFMMGGKEGEAIDRDGVSKFSLFFSWIGIIPTWKLSETR